MLFYLNFIRNNVHSTKIPENLENMLRLIKEEEIQNYILSNNNNFSGSSQCLEFVLDNHILYNLTEYTKNDVS